MANFRFLFVLLILFVLKIHASKLFRESKLVGRDQNKINKHNIKEEWFVQYLDHFDLTDTRKWKQRYFINDQFYKDSSGGPIFLMLGGEGEASIEWMSGGDWIDNTKRFGALCFQLEHRFYGKSHPTEGLSTENLRYLTIEQALADLAEFIVAMNEAFNLRSNTKWIAFGGSYAGSLVARLRLKYPHLVYGAVSSSGVFSARVDYSSYLQTVAESLKVHSDDCVNAVKDGFSETEIFLQQNKNRQLRADTTRATRGPKKGQQVLNKIFRLCDPIEESVKNKNDIATLYNVLSANFAGIAQSNKVNSAFIVGSNSSNITVDTVCDIMVTKDKGSPIHRLADFINLMLNSSQWKCLNYKYDKLVECWKNTSWMETTECSDSTYGFSRQWIYQTCTGIGYFQTTSFSSHVFGNKCPVEYFIQRCEDIFGPEFNSTFIYDTVRRTETTYGGLNIKLTNTVIIQGSQDPWHLVGIIQNTTHGPPVIYIKGTAHMADMFPESENDLPQLKAARKQIAEYINNWLQQ